LITKLGHALSLLGIAAASATLGAFPVGARSPAACLSETASRSSVGTHVTGPQKTLVILAKFADSGTDPDLGQTDTAFWGGLFFGVGTAHPSIRDYFRGVSYDAADIVPASETSGAQNDGVVGWIALNQNASDYQQQWCNSVGCGTLCGVQVNWEKWAAHAAVMAADSFVDFSSFDTETSPGHLDARELRVFVVFAAFDASYACAGGLYPEVWRMHFEPEEQPPDQLPDLTIQLDGVSIGSVALAGEMLGNGSDPPFPNGMGKLAHELGHSFGWDDQYATEGHEAREAGTWCLMASGDGTEGSSFDDPSHPCAFDKLRVGWVDSVTVVDPRPISLLGMNGSARPTVYKVLNAVADDSTYYLLENRRKPESGFERMVPDSGLLVWSVDLRNADPCSLVQADANGSIGAGDTFPRPDLDRFTCSTTPHADFARVVDITETSGIITANAQRDIRLDVSSNPTTVLPNGSAQSAITAQLQDSCGRAKRHAGVMVTFTIVAGSEYGTLTGDTTVATDSAGVATCGFLAGLYEGAVVIEASASGFPSGQGDVLLVGTHFCGAVGDTTWFAANSPYIVTCDVRVGKFPGTAILTIEPGTRVLFQPGCGLRIGWNDTYTRKGSLAAIGTESDPIVFSSATGQPNGWKGIFFDAYPRGAGTLRHCVIENAGEVGIGGQVAAVEIGGEANPVLIDDSVIRECGGHGVYNAGTNVSVASSSVHGTSDVPIWATRSMTVDACSLSAAETYAVYSTGPDLVLTNNVLAGHGPFIARLGGKSTIAGNSYGGSSDVIELYGATFGADRHITHPGNSDGSYEVLGDILVGYVTSHPRLTIDPGVRLKFRSGFGLQVCFQSGAGTYYDGRLLAVGTESAPIVLTSASGAPGGWKGVYFFGAEATGTLRHCIVENAGEVGLGGQPAAIHVGGTGLGPVVIDSSVVRACDGYGIHTSGYDVTISRVTVDSCRDAIAAFHSRTVIGNVIATSSTTGHGVFGGVSGIDVTCCDVWNNAGGDYGGVLPDQTGLNGNIAVDPMFCDPANSDLRLSPDSPCIDTSGCGRIGALGPGCGTCEQIEPWSISSSALPDSLRDAAAVAVGPYLFVSGGLKAGGMTSSLVHVARIMLDSVAPWTPAAPMPDSLRDHGMVSVGGWIYALGGSEGSIGTPENPVHREVHDEVWKAAAGAHGTLSPWSGEGVLPVPLWAPAVCAWDQTLYVSGGSANDTVWAARSGRIFRAHVDSTSGTLSPWVESPVDLPVSVASHRMLAHGGRLWVIGGEPGPPGTAIPDVFSTGILADGSLDPAWVVTTPLPEGRHSFGASVFGDRLYVVGGMDPSGLSRRSVFETDLFGDGTTSGTWSVCDEGLPALPGFGTSLGVSNMAFAQYGCTVYSVGGYVWSDQPDHGFVPTVISARLTLCTPAVDAPGAPPSSTRPLPVRYHLARAVPNPFRSSTSIVYDVPAGHDGSVGVAIFDVAGRLVRRLVQDRVLAGRHTVEWDGTADGGRRVGSGVYFCRMWTSGFAETRKVIRTD